MTREPAGSGGSLDAGFAHQAQSPMAVRPPKSLRQTIHLFADYRPGTALAAFFARIDWTGVSRRQLIHAFFDRPPAEAAEALEPAGFDPAAAALEIFRSQAFRTGLIARIFEAFGRRRRILFVHLPKCAGTDFEQVLRQRMPILSAAIEMAHAMPPEQLAAEFHRLALGAPGADMLACGGHFPLAYFLDAGLFRFNDKLITIVRPPTEIAVSFTNYVLARFGADPGLADADTRSWAARLGMDAAQIAQECERPRDFALRLVTFPGFMPVNPLCALLGDGTLAGAANQLARAPIEITTVARYDGWLAKRWNGARSVRVNAQPQILTWNDLAHTQQETIRAACVDDELLFAGLTAALGTRLATTGPQAVRALSGQVA